MRSNNKARPSRRLIAFVSTLLVLFSTYEVIARPDGNSINKSKPTSKTKAFQPKSKVPSTTATPRATSQASSSLRRIRQEYNDAVKMGIAYDWVNQKRISSKKKKKKKQLNNSSNENDASAKYICLGPLTNNMRHWHFSFRGAGDVFGKGIYHGRILLPKDYPLSPPHVQLRTESGRFKPGVDICLSASAYHPESWTPKWTIFGLVNALRLHMLQSPIEIGGITTSHETMEELAQASQTWFKRWWSGGSVEIQVSHKKILKEGILTLEDGDDDVDLEQIVSSETTSLSNLTNETELLSEDSSPTSSERMDAAVDGAGHDDDSSAVIRKESTGDTATTFIDKEKMKKKSRKKQKTKPAQGDDEAQQLSRQHLLHSPKAFYPRSHIRLMKLTRTLTDPVTVVFITVIILIWLNKR